jgi:hypothetical protein
MSINSYFANDLKEDFMGAYDHGKETGTLHFWDHNIVKGAKLGEWGSGPVGQVSEIDFFAKFGEPESENLQLSGAYMLKGLGYKDLGDTKTANENLQKAVELSASNLWANTELLKQ